MPVKPKNLSRWGAFADSGQFSTAQNVSKLFVITTARMTSLALGIKLLGSQGFRKYNAQAKYAELRRQGEFDVLLAWNEDRLCRGYRPMVDLLDVLENTRLVVMLARGTFDRDTFPIKVWAAKAENERRADRIRIGHLGRVKRGLPHSNAPLAARAALTGELAHLRDQITELEYSQPELVAAIDHAELRRRMLEFIADSNRLNRPDHELRPMLLVLLPKIYIKKGKLVMWEDTPQSTIVSTG